MGEEENGGCVNLIDEEHFTVSPHYPGCLPAGEDPNHGS